MRACVCVHAQTTSVPDWLGCLTWNFLKGFREVWGKPRGSPKTAFSTNSLNCEEKTRPWARGVCLPSVPHAQVPLSGRSQAESWKDDGDSRLLPKLEVCLLRLLDTPDRAARGCDGTRDWQQHFPEIIRPEDGSKMIFRNTGFQDKPAFQNAPMQCTP